MSEMSAKQIVDHLLSLRQELDNVIDHAITDVVLGKNGFSKTDTYNLEDRLDYKIHEHTDRLRSYLD